MAHPDRSQYTLITGKSSNVFDLRASSMLTSFSMSLKDILDWIAYLLAKTFKDAGDDSSSKVKRAHARDIIAN